MKYNKDGGSVEISIFTVLLEMMGICLLLALAAGMVSVVTIMRYEPLQILSNRD